MECYFQEKTKILGKKPVPVTLRPRQIPHVLSRDPARHFTLWTGLSEPRHGREWNC